MSIGEIIRVEQVSLGTNSPIMPSSGLRIHFLKATACLIECSLSCRHAQYQTRKVLHNIRTASLSLLEMPRMCKPKSERMIHKEEEETGTPFYVKVQLARWLPENYWKVLTNVQCHKGR